MKAVCIAVGSFIGLRNVRQDRRPRGLRRLERKSKKYGPGQVPRNWENGRSIEEGWLFS